MRTALLLADRTAVLFLGIAAGAAIGYAFGSVAEEAPPPPATIGAPGVAAPPGAAGSSVTPGATVVPGSRPPAAIAPPPPGGLAAPSIPATAAIPSTTYPQPFQPHLLRAIAAGEPVTVGVFGDSFGDGVWSAMYRLLPKKDRYRVLKFSRQSTGFTRYGRLNLQDHAADQIAQDGPVDIAVVSFGANDTQGVYADGHAAALMSPEWQRIVGARVDGFVGLLRSRGVTVYWLGLPKMRAAAFDADIAAMNDFYRRRMAALGVPFIEVQPLTVDAEGRYAAYLPDPVNGNEPRLLRANDGIHMSMNGYIVITRALAAQIRDYVAAATRVALPNGPPPGSEPPAPPPPPAPAPRRAVEPARPPERRADLPRRAEEKPRPDAAPPSADARPARRDVPREERASSATPAPRPSAEKPAERRDKAAETAPKATAAGKKPAAVPVVRAGPPPLQLKLPPPEPETVAPSGGDRR